jgi:hypothetical protein
VPKLDYTINYLVTLYKYAPTNSSSSQLNNVAVAYNGNKKKENKKNQIIRMETEYNRKPRLPLEANYETDLYSRDRVQLSNTAPYSIYAYPTNHHMPTSDLSIGSIEITHNDHKPNPNKDNKGADHLNTEYDDPIIMLKLRKHRTILVSEHVDHTSRITSLDNNIKPNKLNKTIKHDIEPNRPSHYMILNETMQLTTPYDEAELTNYKTRSYTTPSFPKLHNQSNGVHCLLNYRYITMHSDRKLSNSLWMGTSMDSMGKSLKLNMLF